MNKLAILKDLTKLANKLDEQGEYKVASALDGIIRKNAQQKQPPRWFAAYKKNPNQAVKDDGKGTLWSFVGAKGGNDIGLLRTSAESQAIQNMLEYVDKSKNMNTKLLQGNIQGATNVGMHVDVDGSVYVLVRAPLKGIVPTNQQQQQQQQQQKSNQQVDVVARMKEKHANIFKQAFDVLKQKKYNPQEVFDICFVDGDAKQKLEESYKKHSDRALEYMANEFLKMSTDMKQR